LQRIILGIKILTLSSQYIVSLLLFVVNNRDYSVANSVFKTLIPDKEMIYTCLRYLWACIRREFIIQAPKSLMVFSRQLKTSPVSLRSLKLL